MQKEMDEFPSVSIMDEISNLMDKKESLSRKMNIARMQSGRQLKL